jgi:hypothetical protein
VIHADEAVFQLKNAKSQLEAAEEDLKNQKQLLDLAWRLLQHDDFLGGGPCCGVVQESSS